MGFEDAILQSYCSFVCPKGVDPALGIQLLGGHLLSNSKNEKQTPELIDK
jgi:succinate dehydrogenase / fumarate reductase, iron-sulfur subunit